MLPILHKLKLFIIQKKFDSALIKYTQKRVVSQKEIKSVGILLTEENSLKINIQKEIETILGVKNTKLYIFKKDANSDEVSYKHFLEKDMNWKGKFYQPNFKNFLEQPFDLLIGYFNTNNLFLEASVLQSKATFKAGFSNVNSNLYELEINEKIKNTKPFSLELKKYLQLLKKL